MCFSAYVCTNYVEGNIIKCKNGSRKLKKGSGYQLAVLKFCSVVLCIQGGKKNIIIIIIIKTL